MVSLNDQELPGGVTEVYVTKVGQENLAKFLAWHEKIHRLESTFPGFQKVYIQEPTQDPNQDKESEWITLLQFDSLINLQNWLSSEQRAGIIKESQEFISSKETHRLLSSFGGWFSDRSLTIDPPKWKQTMLILAVLYPIVMMQYFYMAPYLNLDLVLKTFVQNVVCVSLLTWPMIPLAIYALSWWLDNKSNTLKEILGIAVLLSVYTLEMIVFKMIN